MKSCGGETCVRPLVRMPDHTTWRTRGLTIEDLKAKTLMFIPDAGSILLFWVQLSLRRSLRQVQSTARLYEALAVRETDKAFGESYRVLANQQRCRAARKLSRLSGLRARLPVDRDRITARALRRLLIFCGPKVAAAWIDWRETRELAVMLVVARAITRLARIRGRNMQAKSIARRH
jgi:hypothetical protein